MMPRAPTGKACEPRRESTGKALGAAVLALGLAALAALSRQSLSPDNLRRLKIPPSGSLHRRRQEAGITFLEDSTGTEEKYYLETMGTGVGWLDYDQDGWMDLYFRFNRPPRIVTSRRILAFRALPQQWRRNVTDVTAKRAVAWGGRPLRPGRGRRRFRQ